VSDFSLLARYKAIQISTANHENGAHDRLSKFPTPAGPTMATKCTILNPMAREQGETGRGLNAETLEELHCLENRVVSSKWLADTPGTCIRKANRPQDIRY
jgi:hypothetical protein